MIGDETPPGRLERLMLRVPEGSVLRLVFSALVAVSIAIVVVDYQNLSERAAEQERTSRTEPMPLRRPQPGDQIRPYLPKTIPVGPDRGEPELPGYDGPVEGEALAEPMRFFVGKKGEATAIGRIEVGTAKALQAFLDKPESAGVQTLVLHSPGGSVADAIAMARDIRARKVSTRVPADGYCASACPLVLAGGLTRRAGDGAWVGVHQVYAVSGDEPGLPSDVDRSIADIQQTSAECQNLLAEMGIDPALWIKAMQTPAASLYVLRPEELVRYRLVRPIPDAPALIGPPAPHYPDFPPGESAADPAAKTAGDLEHTSSL
ncbi:ATP-dependent Clp protease proteolytic subunit [Jiella sp. MQZ9-1]|uniref:ATP-dependent Clp protease proteolytic subunit n=1 Tax=Jiella flava TaxID=2816857 RepID=A0A939FXJ2_9HYPH|nr:ATP-dependent Clp protease proteolytic subunit [Jiella flava]MBO0662596.1 ATP-dependent Clp protease proteolytic subunit [Jiella flava]MCD2471018.1 ATP-dependent Clp protease proteolytic subunit [Jiella flava]